MLAFGSEFSFFHILRKKHKTNARLVINSVTNKNVLTASSIPVIPKGRTPEFD